MKEKIRGFFHRNGHEGVMICSSEVTHASGLVDAVGIEERLFLRRHIMTLFIQFGKEAARIAGVAGAAMLLDLKEEGVSIAIHKPTKDLLGVTTRFAFFPEFFTRTAPVVHESGLYGITERILIHPGHH